MKIPLWPPLHNATLLLHYTALRHIGLNYATFYNIGLLRHSTHYYSTHYTTTLHISQHHGGWPVSVANPWRGWYTGCMALVLCGCTQYCVAVRVTVLLYTKLCCYIKYCFDVHNTVILYTVLCCYIKYCVTVLSNVLLYTLLCCCSHYCVII